KGSLVNQRRTDRIGSVDNGAIRRVAESVADGRNVGAAPLTDPEALRDLFGDVMAKHRKLAAEVVIDADNLFLQIRGRFVAADKRGPPVRINGVGLGENSSG